MGIVCYNKISKIKESVDRMDVIQLLSERFEYVNNTEKEIIMYIIQNGKTVKNLELQTLAKEMYIAPNTITRLCKKIGLSGYGELRLKLKEHFIDRKEEVQVTTIEEQLLKTQNLISQKQIDAAVDLLVNADKVVIYAVGPSWNIAEYFVTYMQFIGIQAYSFLDPNIMKINAENLSQNDVVFVISVSGETIAPKQATILAKTRGAAVISLTGHSFNSIANEATIPLYVDAAERYYKKFDISNRFSMQYVVNVIVEKLVERLVDNKV